MMYLALQPITEHYNKGERAFTIGDYVFSLRLLDMKLIFGIVDGDKNIDDEGLLDAVWDSDFLHRRFPNRNQGTRAERKLTTKRIKDTLLVVSKGREVAHYEDTARLLTLYILNTLFVTTSKPSLKWSYCNFVGEMQKMCEYDWTLHFFGKLAKSLDENASMSEKVVACVMLIPYWFLERMNVVYLNTGNEDEVIPRCAKWVLKDLTKDIYATSVKFNKDKLIS